MSAPQAILLHGLGHDPVRVVAQLANALPPYVPLVVPPGPLVFGEGPGRAWFGVSFTDAGPVADVEQARQSRHAIIDVASGRPRSLIVGFGQGGVIALTAFLERPDLFIGCAVVSGRVLMESLPQLPPTGLHKGLPLFWAHGRSDPAIAYPSALAGREALEDYGFKLTICDHDGGHELPPSAASSLRTWIDDLLELSGVDAKSEWKG